LKGGECNIVRAPQNGIVARRWRHDMGTNAEKRRSVNVTACSARRVTQPGARLVRVTIMVSAGAFPPSQPVHHETRGVAPRTVTGDRIHVQNVV